MIEQPGNNSCDKLRCLAEWFCRYRCSAEIQLSRYEGSHLLERVTAPLPAKDAEQQEVEFNDAVWQWETQIEPVPDREGTVDLNVRFKLARGAAAQCNAAVSFAFADWSTENYVLIPAAVYNGNRFESRSIPYPPILREPADIGPDVPSIITDVPRLNIHHGFSRIQLLAGDGATPAVGFYAPASGNGCWLLTEQQTRLGDSGITVEESDDRRQAIISIAAPGVRRDVKYTMCTTQTPCDDRGADFAAGDEVTIRLRLFFFECGGPQGLFDRFVEIRKDLSGPAQLKHELPFSEAMTIIEERFNRSDFNWIEKYGFYTYKNPIHYFGTGWAGGMIHTYPLLMEGDDLSRGRVLKTFDFFFNNMLAPSGLFYANHDGEKVLTLSSRGLPHAKTWVLIRRNCDALYFILKQFMSLERQKPELQIPASWRIGARRCAEALVRLWKEYGQFGQFVDQNSGEIMVGGSTSGALAPGVLALASRYFEEKAFLKVAEQSARYYHEHFVKRGLSSGGPGEALQCPDSESAFHMLESFVVLYEVTGDRQWLALATEMAHQCASWCVSYDFEFPADSPFGELGMRTTGAVYANAQNKHAAPGICTLSGDSLFKLYRATGDRFCLELLREIAHNLTQYVSRSDRPIRVENEPERALPPGWVNERVNMSDWEGKDHIGRVFWGSNWCETSVMLTYAEVPGLYVQPDTGLVCAIDHVDVETIERGRESLVLKVTNPTLFEATVKLYSENSAEMPNPLRPDYLVDCRKIKLAPGESRELRIPVFGTSGA